MKNKNLAVLFTLVLGTCAIGVSIGIADGLKCEKPKEHSKKACLDPLPNNAVSSCGSVQYKDYCNGYIGGPISVYEVKQFPSGTEAAESGGTYMPQRECWRFHGCAWDSQEKRCVDLSVWSPWYLKNRIESDPDAECPDE